MGVYLNPGCQRFSETVQSQIYVDKTEMISFLNTLVSTEQKYISVSRPRRFGKSITANMLCAYYGRGADSRSLFADKELAAAGSSSSFTWDRYLGTFDVIRIVMTDFFKSDISVPDSLKRLQTLVVRDLRKAYPDVDFFDCGDLPQSMSDLYAEKANRFVVIIDEWDAVFRIRPQDKEGQTKYLDFLRDWLKDKDYIALAYMTGILPIKKYGQHSALNMFFEFSMTAPMQLARYTGFTEEEVSDLCRKYGRNFEEIRSWYDGYQVSDIIPPDPEHQLLKQQGSGPAARKYSLYSPLSVVNAVSTGFIQNYWNRTETYEALADYIRMDFDDLQNTVALMMDGARIRVDVSRYQNDMTTFHGKDDVLALLIHLGYLGYDMETQEAFVPNKEILEEFRTSTQTAEWGPVFEALKQS